MEFPDPCPTGSYCPAYVADSGIDNVIPCPAGTYSFNEYLTEVGGCIDCPPGKYCEEGSSTFTGYCDSGYVCVIGADVANPNPLATADVNEGTFTFDDYTSANNGPCPTGHYCPYGSGYPRKCPAGQYQEFEGYDECNDCPEGSYCAEAGLSAVTGTCSPGFWCIIGSVFYKPYDYAMGRICAKG
jgi:hypothetical protein